MDYLELNGKVAIVTGGASGIGQAIARELNRYGTAVAVVDINESAGSEMAKELSEAGPRSIAMAVDVTDSEAVNECVDSVSREFGTVDILVNAAGVNFFVKPDEMTDDQWAQVISLNLDGPFYMIRAAIPVMKANGGGKVVNISSGAGLSGIPEAAHYTAAKHGVIGLTRALAADLGPHNIHVNAVCPGTTMTPLVKRILSKAHIEHEVDRYALGRLGQPEDIARAVVFLSSSASDWITGVALPVDGGLTACLRVRRWVDEDEE